MRLMILVSLLVVPCLADYRPDRDGASTCVGLEVYDVNGRPIEGAKVMFRIFTTFDDCYKLMRDTDDRGYCEITCKTRGEITVDVTKDGYYTSHGNLDYRDLSWDESVAEHKWTRGLVKNHISMKPVVNPEKLIVGGMTLKSPPAKNRLLPFDAFMFDWCAPFGKGKVTDFEIGCYDMTNSVRGRVRGVRIKADSCADGFSLRRLDEWSSFRYALNAGEKDEYVKELIFGWVPDAHGEIIRGMDFSAKDYLVFRVRTATNEVGRVVAANYGIVDENLDFQDGLTLNIRLNPRQNDTSLEHDRVYKNMQKHKRSAR